MIVNVIAFDDIVDIIKIVGMCYHNKVDKITEIVDLTKSYMISFE